MDTGTFPYASTARRRALPLGVVLLLCLATVAGRSGDAFAAAVPGSPCPPPPPAPVLAGSPLAPKPVAVPAPPEVVVACVGQYPITGAAFDHWAKVARKSAAPERAREHGIKSHPLSVATTIKEVMAFLISGDWVIGEAARLEIDVSEATVRRRFDRIRDEQFPHRREFRKFLRDSGQTIGDLLLRVRLNILSVAIQKRILGSAPPNDRQRTSAEFVKGFKARWQAQTVCVKAYLVADCGATQEPPL